jgi:hypothetical protein
MKQGLPLITEPTGMFPKTSKTRRENTFMTNCKLCRGGIHREDPHVWLTNPMGLSHMECAITAGLAKGDEWGSSVAPARRRPAPVKATKRARVKAPATASTAPTGGPPDDVAAVGEDRPPTGTVGF